MVAGSKSKPVNKLWEYRWVLLRYRWSLLFGVVTLLITNMLSVAIPWLVKDTVDMLQQESIHHQHQTDKLYYYLSIILGISIAMLFIRIVSRLFILGIGRKLEYDLRNMIYKHLLGMPQSFFMANPTGELMSRLTNDVGSIRYLTGGGILLGVNTTLAYLMTFPMMASISPKLTLYAFLLYPIAIFLMRKLSQLVKRYYYQVQDVLGDISTVAQENFTGMGVIQSYAKEPVESNRFYKVCKSYYDTFCKLIGHRVWLFLVMAMVSGFSFLIVLAEGGREVMLNEINLGGFVAFTLYLEKLAWPTMALGWAISIFQQGAAAMERIDEVLSAKSTIDTSPASGDQPASKDLSLSLSATAIEIRNLNFTYLYPYGHGHGSQHKGLTAIKGEDTPAHEERAQVLENINLTIPEGATVAFVGPVGSGKSTLLSLLPRLYEVPEGSIFINGQDITEIHPHALRESMAFMPQHSFLFSTTITRNIAYGMPEAPEHQVVEYSELAHLHNEVVRFENQYNTIVGERGVILSGGQRQRLSLARALMVNPPLLILDDPFSHLDAETERQIIAALKTRKVFHNKTTLFATHRFSMVQEADWVVLMDQGRIVATGTHEKLMAEQPLYQRLNRLEVLKREMAGDLLE